MIRLRFHRRAPGYTLTEFLLAGLLVALLLITLMSAYVTSYSMLRRGVVQSWAQQKGYNALGLVLDKVRPGVGCLLYANYGVTPGTNVATGNYLKVFTLACVTSAFYRSGSTLYYVENEEFDNRSTSADDVVLATDLGSDTRFIASYGEVKLLLSIRDPRATNTALVHLDAYVTPRNQ